MTDYSQQIAELKRERGTLTSTPGNSKRLRSVDAELVKLRASRSARHDVERPAGVETADQDHSRTETAAAPRATSTRSPAKKVRKRAAPRSD